MLPASVADEQINDLLRAIPDHPGMLERVVDSLFTISLPSAGSPRGAAAPPRDGLSAGWRAADASMAGMPDVDGLDAVHDVVQSVQDVCAAHGVVPMHSRLVRLAAAAPCAAHAIPNLRSRAQLRCL